MESYTTRKTCRVCDSDQLTPLFTLGEQYVSNFVREDEPDGIKCPIELELCRNCTLVQLKHTAPQEILYKRTYWYRSGVTDTMRAALRDITKTVEEMIDLKPGDVVLDIGSNDGTLLRSYTHPGIIKVGVEPATNLAEQGRQGVDVFINDFWSREEYEERFGGPAKVVTAIGMFYDLEDPNQFIRDVAEVLAPDGVFIAQLMCLRNMINVGDIGNLAHEHLEFYSLKSLDYLLGRWGLEIFDIDKNNVNGESYRLFIRHKSNEPLNSDQTLRMRAARFAEIDLDNPKLYRHLFDDMERNKERVVDFIKQEVAAGNRVWVYGASTKGNVILQWLGLSYTVIEGAADRSPEKWGRYTVGSRIPIYSEAYARATRPDYFLVLPYAFRDEFLLRERVWRIGGGKFIFPLPKLEIV